MGDPADPLEVWSVGTFDVVGFGLLAVLVGHESGGLADVLLGIGTLSGLATFGYLWALVLVATRWVLSDGGLDRSRDGELAALLARGSAGGAFVGAAFVLGIFLTVGFVDVVEDWTAIGTFLYLAFLGAAVGIVVGTVVGTTLAIVNVCCYRATDLVVPPASEEPTTTGADGRQDR